MVATFTNRDCGYAIPIWEITPNVNAVLDRLQAQNATVLRTDADWLLLQPTNPTSAASGLNDTYDAGALADLDAVVNGAHARGIHVILSLWITPNWSHPTFTGDKIPPTRDLTNHGDPANIAWFLANRYGDKITIEYGNEPNISTFYKQPASTSTIGAVDSPDVVQFSAQLTAVYNAVKTGVVFGRATRAAHPEVLVITGGTSPATGDGTLATNYAPANFLAGILFIAPTKFDHIGHHPYMWVCAPDLNVEWNPMRQTDLLWAWLKTSRPDADIWATECGIISRPDVSGTDPTTTPCPNGGYASGAIGPNYNTSARAISYTLAAQRATEILAFWRSHDRFDATVNRTYTGPLCVFKVNDTHVPTDWTGSDEHHFGAFEYGTTGYDGPAKPVAAKWAALFAPPTDQPEKWEWIDPDGLVYRLDSNIDGVQIVETVSGRGMPKNRRTTEIVPLQPGTRLRSTVHDERQVSIGMLFSATNAITLRDILRTWIARFDPSRGDGKLRVTGPAGDVRELSCSYLDGLELDEAAGMRLDQVALVTFVASDPYWSAVEDSQVSWTRSQPPSFFPLLPLKLGSSGAFARATVVNSGDVQTYPVWIVGGPGHALVLTNLLSGRRLAWSGTLGVGEYIVIDCRDQNQSETPKDVLKNDGTKQFGFLTAYDFWPLEKGAQEILIEMSDTSSLSVVTASWRPRFLGA